MTSSARVETSHAKERRWAWLLPAAVLDLGDPIGSDAHGIEFRVEVGVWFLACVGIGAVWQLLYRRDVVDRFRLLAILFVAAMLVATLFGTVSRGRVDALSLIALPSIASGVILTESWLRSRRGPLP